MYTFKDCYNPFDPIQDTESVRVVESAAAS